MTLGSLWKKNRPGRVGGKVHASYYSYTAVMLGCCNHVAGVMFRVEDAVKRGLTKIPKTSLQDKSPSNLECTTLKTNHEANKSRGCHLDQCLLW